MSGLTPLELHSTKKIICSVLDLGVIFTWNKNIWVVDIQERKMQMFQMIQEFSQRGL